MVGHQIRRFLKAKLAALGALAGANVWLASSYVGPIRNVDPPDFVFQSRPLYELVLWLVAGVAGLLLLHRRRSLERVDWSPLVLLVLPPATMAAMLTPARVYAGPWLFLFVDGRSWFLSAVAALQALAYDAGTGGYWRMRLTAAWSRIRSRRSAPLWADSALAFVLVGAALAFSPPDRSVAYLIGDEPKYVRFMENWYRGNGLDVGNLPPVPALAGAEHAHVLRNVALLVSEVPVLAADLVADARRAIGLSAPPHVGPARSDGGWFVEGKRGGLYQVHNPGFSALLFPGYFVDRYFLNWGAEEGQFPPRLYATNVLLIALFVLWGIALFRLLTAYTRRPALSWLLALIAMLSLPAGAFHYQFYPESGAGLAITVLAYYVMFSTDTRPRVALAFGLLAGYLPWMHLRFGPAAVAAVVAFAVVKRRAPRAVMYCWGGFAVVLAALGLYYYHIAGNPLPWTLYDVVPESPGFSVSRMMYGMPRFVYDWRGGVIAHAPVYLLALPGLLLFWRARPHVGLTVSALVLAVAGIAAAHNWFGAGTSPSRLIAAVVPLLALPLADAVVRFSRSRLFVAAFVLLAASSVANGLIFARYFERTDQALYARTTSGWMTPLLMPLGDGVDDRLLVAWWMLTAAAIALPWIASAASGFRRTISWTVATAAVLTFFLAAGLAASAYHGETFGERFARDEEVVAREVVAAHAAHPSGVTWTARRGRVDPVELFPAAAQEAAARSAAPAAAEPGQPATDEGDAESPDAVRGLPANLVAQPVALTIESVSVSGSEVVIRCAADANIRVGPEDQFWVWMIGGDIGRARLQTVRPSSVDPDGRRLTLTFTAAPPPRDNEYLRLLAGVTAQGSVQAGRTRVVRLYWPGAQLTLGAPIVMKGTELP